MFLGTRRIHPIRRGLSPDQLIAVRLADLQKREARLERDERALSMAIERHRSNDTRVSADIADQLDEKRDRIVRELREVKEAAWSLTLARYRKLRDSLCHQEGRCSHPIGDCEGVIREMGQIVSGLTNDEFQRFLDEIEGEAA